MHTTELEKIAALPLVQEAIRVQAEAAEAESLTARLAILDAYRQTADAMADLNSKAAELDAMQDELDHQRDELGRQRAAHASQIQRTSARHRACARELRDRHGSKLAASIATVLGIHAESLRREAEFQRGLLERKLHWTGEINERPSPEGQRKAAELEQRAEQIERERDAIMALQFARVSPHAIERDIQARVKCLGFNLNAIPATQEGWRVTGWEAGPKTKAA